MYGLQGLLSPDERQQAMFQGLLNAGPLLMAAGAPSTTPGGNMGLLGGLGQAFAQPQQQMMQNKFATMEYENMMAEQERQAAEREREAAMQARIPGLLAEAGVDPSMAELFAYDRNAAIDYLTREQKPFTPDIETIYRGNEAVQGYFDQNGQFVEMGSGSRFAPQQPSAANYTNFANRSGDVQSVDLSTPEGRARAQALTEQGYFKTGANITDTFGGLSGDNVMSGPVDQAGKPIPPAKDHQWGKDESGNWIQTVIPGTPSAVEMEAAEAATTEGKQAALADADQMISLLDQAMTHPGLSGVVGLPNVSGGLVGGYMIPGTDEASFQALMDQIGGNVFLEAYQTLKGSGTITEVEGAKAEAAIARLSTAQKEEDFKAALAELRGIVQAGRDRLTGGSTGNAPDGVPDGVDPALWELMTPEEKALWQN